MSTFLQVADYYLVSQAHAGKHIVVTHSASSRRIKIPDACIGLGIKCMTPLEVLRLERAVRPGTLTMKRTSNRLA